MAFRPTAGMLNATDPSCPPDSRDRSSTHHGLLRGTQAGDGHGWRGAQAGVLGGGHGGAPLQDSAHHTPLVTAGRLAASSHPHTQARGKFGHHARCLRPGFRKRTLGWKVRVPEMNQPSASRRSQRPGTKQRTRRRARHGAARRAQAWPRGTSGGLLGSGHGTWACPAPHVLGQFPGGRIQESGTQSPRPLRPGAS